MFRYENKGKDLAEFCQNFLHAEVKPSEIFFKKSCSFKFHNIHREIPVLDPIFNKVACLYKKQTLKQVFSREYCEFFNNSICMYTIS